VVSDVAAKLEIPFFVVGATARDMVLEFGYGITPSRATRDIDIGVQVASWEQFNNLKTALVGTKKFRNSGAAQRLFYENNLPIDLVPFGDISGEDAFVDWPPDHEVTMNVLGFDEACANALLVKLSSSPDLEVRVASPAGWALLKIISWGDRVGGERLKDALDLSLILRKYAEAGNQDRLFETESGLFKEEGFDIEMAGARLLGKDISRLANKAARERILEILEQQTGERERYKLVEDIMQHRAFAEDGFNKSLELLEKLQQGFAEASRQS